MEASPTRPSFLSKNSRAPQSAAASRRKFPRGVLKISNSYAPLPRAFFYLYKLQSKNLRFAISSNINFLIIDTRRNYIFFAAFFLRAP
jgi:hypothetical protein